jgi:glutathione S-transferase
MIRLYQLERCPWCAAARQGLANVGVEHELVNVPYERGERADVLALTGQALVPVLVDGDTVVWDSRRIVRYLYETYGGAERARSISELPADTGGMRTLGDACAVPDVHLT